MSSLVSSDLDDIEDALKKLRISYEKYFAGVERVEPLKERDGLKRAVQRLLGDNSKNTARRFRLQTINASLVTYEQYWNRVTRQIEEGTFKRDRVRADKILKAAGLEPRNPLAEVLAEMGPDLDDLEVEDDDLMPMDDDSPVETPETATASTPSAPTAVVKAATRPPQSSTLAGVDEALAMAALATSRGRPTGGRPAAPAPAAAAAPSAPAAQPGTRPVDSAAASRSTSSPVPPAPTTGYSASVRQLHQSYVTARQGTGERDAVSLDAFAATLQKQAAAIKSRFKCSEVEFKVALKDGKAILKATPR
jgi:hypothetical protein